ncbi:hypothetical protein AIOGIFDO_01338 [Candidatus Methanoperedenaceae archaeon GB37]|nr:hypothetical protein AIOGIFDO_01338 [Candidatus Methanoperedenaceae archaeon GB37]
MFGVHVTMSERLIMHKRIGMNEESKPERRD